MAPRKLMSAWHAQVVHVDVLEHPVVAAQLTELRDEATDRRRFRQLLHQVARALVFELAEELWAMLGHEVPLTAMDWPQAEDSLAARDSVTVAVQVNGKLRGTLDLPKDSDQSAAEGAALALDTVQAAMAGKQARKVIVVPNRVINVVV